MKERNQAPMWIREIVWINAAVFLAFGAAFLAAPAQLAGWLDVELGSPSALADVRAMYGGLSLACGLLFVFGLRRESWFMPSLFLVMTTSAGLALGRSYSMLVSGVPGPLVLALLATEVGSFAWALLGYRALEATEPSRAALGNPA